MSTQDSNSNVPAEQDTPTRLLKEGSSSADTAQSGTPTSSSDPSTPSPTSSSKGSNTPVPTIKTDTPVEGKRRKERSQSATGRTINMWQLAEKLGEGGMGTVYKAKHQLLDRTVAIKLLHSNLLNESKSRLRFQEEAMAVGALNHRNIVDVSDCGVTEEGEPFLVMELLNGMSLSSMIKSSGGLSLKQAVPIFVQICQGLEHAHRNGTIHRDLKPSNVIVADGPARTEVVKIVDFGIAKRLSTENDEALQKLTSTGELVGSPIYMSPEQCRGTVPDARSDVYSLGILMYETLTGAPPFAGNTFFETLAMHLDSAVPRFAGKGASPDLAAMEQIVLHCLAKFPGDRYQTVEEVQTDLLKQFKHLLPQEKQIHKLPFGWKLTIAASILILLIAAESAAFQLYNHMERVNKLPDSNSFMPFDLWPIYKRMSTKEYEEHLRNNEARNALPDRANNLPKEVRTDLQATLLRTQGLIKLNAQRFDEAKSDLELALSKRQDDLHAAKNDLQCIELKADIAKALEGKKQLNEAYELHRQSFDFIANTNPTDANSWAQGALSYARICVKKATATGRVNRELMAEGRAAYQRLIEALPNQFIGKDQFTGEKAISHQLRRDKFLAQARCLLADTYRVYERTDEDAKKFGETFFPLRNEIKAVKASKDPNSKWFKLKEQMRLLKKNGMDPAPFMIPRDLYNTVIETTEAQGKANLQKTAVDEYVSSAVAETETYSLTLARAHWCRGLLYRKNGNDAVANEEFKLAVTDAKKALLYAKFIGVPRQVLILALRDYSSGLWKSDPIQAFQLRLEAANLLAESQLTAE